MKDRIKEIRKSHNLTQSEFGERIGIKGNTVTSYETGLRVPSDAVVLSICREFGVNEIWLRTGEGEMFQQFSRDEEIAAFVGRVLSPKGLDIQRRFIAALSQLDEEDWLVLDKFIDLMQKDKKKD